ncbi:MAG: deacylase, partial [Pseudomonadota bacterium]
RVEEGELLGRVTDPITNETVGLYAPTDGRIIGMAKNQVVMPGFAAFHLGVAGQSPDLVQTVDDEDAADKSE